MLKGKLAVVTGATSGIGLAVARHFVKEGATVAAVGRNDTVLKSLHEESGCFPVRADLTEASGGLASGRCSALGPTRGRVGRSAAQSSA